MDVENYDDARLSGEASFTAARMEISLPSGARFTVPKNEVLSLRDLCDAYMREFGKVDIYGREVI